MKQIWLVTVREYLVQVKKKSFILLTIFTPLLIVGLVALVVMLTQANKEVSHIAIVDDSGLFNTSFQSTDSEIYSFYPKEDLANLKDTLTKSKTIQGVLYIPKTDSSYTALRKGIELFSNKNFGVMQISSIENKISSTLEKINLTQKGIKEEDLQKAKVPISIKIQKDSDTGSSQTSTMGEGIKTALSYILMYATFMFIMIYGVRVMRSVIEEKNNRVVEIIISSVKPFNLMMGKILGTTFVALTQFLIWIGIIVLAMLLVPTLISGAMPAAEVLDQAQNLPQESFSTEITEVIDALKQLNYPLIILVFLIYFFFGYLFYSSFFAAIGASVDSETETQQFMWVGLLPLMVGVYGAISIVQNPDGPVGFWLSMIPFTSPVAMMTRISYGVPTWQLLLSISLLIISVILMVWFAAKIYRVGILMYGKKPSIKEWMKWIKY